MAVHYSTHRPPTSPARRWWARSAWWRACRCHRAGLGLARPLTQLGLLMRPDLLHYGGLSGVLHAGVAAAALWLVRASAAGAS